MDGAHPSTDRAARPDAPAAIDLPELLTLVGAAVGPLFAEAGAQAMVRPTVFAVDRALAPLPPKLRMMAGLVLGASTAVRVGVRLEQVLGKMALMGQGASGVRRALGRLEADARWIDGLYISLESLRQIAVAHPIDAAAGLTSPTAADVDDRRFVLSATIALSGRLPLGLDSAEALGRHQDEVLAVALGEAARAGDPGARAVVRDAVASDVTPDEIVLALMFGLGDGSFVRGLEAVVRLARGAIIEWARWGAAAVHASVVLGRCLAGEDEAAVAAVDVARIRRPLLDTLARVNDADAGKRFLEALPAAVAHDLVSCARRALTRYPPAARAAVARVHLEKALFPWRDDEHDARDVHAAPPDRDDGEAAADLLRERSPSVLLVILDIIQNLGQTLGQNLGNGIPVELRSLFARAWSDHPDSSVRRAVATTLAPQEALVAPEALESADVVALPPAALARDDLDRLRAALWAGESDNIVELASCVPLDRRAAARESLLQALDIPNAPLRRAIIDAIGRIGSHSDGPRLIDAAKRYRALEGTVAAALRELGARGMAEPLAEIYQRRLKWADDDAVDDYCAIAGPEQIVHLLHALETRYYPSARAGAARAIARRRASEVVFALRAAALSDTQDNARLAALGALHELTGSGPSGDELAGHALLFRSTEALPETIERAREAGPAALAGIRRTIARGSWKRRRAACDVLATLPGSEATEVLVGVLEDPDEDVRFAAIEALVQRGWKPMSPREHTLQALAARKIREACNGPASELVDSATLVAALGLGGHVFRAEVLEALDDLIGARGFFPTDEQLGVIAAARMDVAAAVMAPGGVEAVLRAIDHTWQANPHRARFVRELMRLPSGALGAQLEGDDPHAPNATPGKRPGLTWRAREAVAQALERADDPKALEALGRLVLEDDDDVRRAALQSLAWIGSAEAAVEVARGLQSPFQEDRDLVARALGALGAAGLAVVGQLANDTWWESRQGAALALGHWKSDAQEAADRLFLLAVDPEYRVAQAAREGLVAHGLMPTTAAVAEALGRAQTLMIEGLEPWLGLQRTAVAPPAIADRLDAMIEETPVDALPQRLGLIATFRAEHLALWLEDVALGRESVAEPLARHVGVRLAAADALRALVRCVCSVCTGEGKVRCPACEGAGEVACAACNGRGTVLIACPDPACTAHGTLRRIDSRRCQTCRGRGEIPVPCACEGGRGRVPCTLCAGQKKLVCRACEGSGHAHPPE